MHRGFLKYMKMITVPIVYKVILYNIHIYLVSIIVGWSSADFVYLIKAIYKLNICMHTQTSVSLAAGGASEECGLPPWPCVVTCAHRNTQNEGKTAKTHDHA